MHPNLSAPISAENPIRVMIADDSLVVRRLLAAFMADEAEIKVAASAMNGRMAVDLMNSQFFDVIILDIEMPVMDGLTALPLLMRADPDVQIIVASTLTQRNAEITLKALAAGAVECLAKPSAQDLENATIFRNELVKKVHALGRRSRRRHTPAPPEEKKFDLRVGGVKRPPDAIAVGSSTGGPEALTGFFSAFGGQLPRQPIFVTQHMPAMFTAMLADQIARRANITCREAVEGEAIEGGRVYLAPGNFHMTIREGAGRKFIALNQDAPENFCRPAVDPMLRSIADVYKNNVLAVILTGMGSDGLIACRALTEAGGTVFAQDEASSVVWGMPGAVALAGICRRVLPPAQLAQSVREFALSGDRP